MNYKQQNVQMCILGVERYNPVQTIQNNVTMQFTLTLSIFDRQQTTIALIFVSLDRGYLYLKYVQQKS